LFPLAREDESPEVAPPLARGGGIGNFFCGPKFVTSY